MRKEIKKKIYNEVINWHKVGKLNGEGVMVQGLTKEDRESLTVEEMSLWQVEAAKACGYSMEDIKQIIPEHII